MKTTSLIKPEAGSKVLYFDGADSIEATVVKRWPMTLSRQHDAEKPVCALELRLPEGRINRAPYDARQAIPGTWSLPRVQAVKAESESESTEPPREHERSLTSAQPTS